MHQGHKTHRQQKRPLQVTRGEEYHKTSDVSAIKTVQVDWKILWADYDLKNLDDFGVGESNAILKFVNIEIMDSNAFMLTKFPHISIWVCFWGERNDCLQMQSPHESEILNRRICTSEK
jgi:hypothetical protein